MSTVWHESYNRMQAAACQGHNRPDYVVLREFQQSCKLLQNRGPGPCRLGNRYSPGAAVSRAWLAQVPCFYLQFWAPGARRPAL